MDYPNFYRYYECKELCLYITSILNSQLIFTPLSRVFKGDQTLKR